MQILIDMLIIFVFLILFAIPWIWGVMDMYALYRFSRKKGIDKTAALIHWWEVKGMITTQWRNMVEKFPWLAKDLAEDRGIRPDDGKVT